tara:strand:- start:413 stop:907 length:495 start_codon:yes stop_codon:yes gene_type:complete
MIIMIGCAGSVKAPKWADKPPAKKGKIYAVGTEKSDRRQSALSQARDEAAIELARQLELYVEQINQRALEEIKDRTSVNVVKSAAATTTAATLKGFKELKTEVSKVRGGMYEAYVLVELDQAKVQENMLDELQKDAKAFQRLKSSEMFQEMKEDVEAYRQRRGY